MGQVLKPSGKRIQIPPGCTLTIKKNIIALRKSVRLCRYNLNGIFSQIINLSGSRNLRKHKAAIAKYPDHIGLQAVHIHAQFFEIIISQAVNP